MTDHNGIASITAPEAGAPAPPKKRPEDFRFGKLIGEGSFSSVYLAKDISSGIEFAIKVCRKTHIIKEKKSNAIRREKEVLTLLSSNRDPIIPFFVRLYATFQDSERLYFVMTFARGGELLTFLQKCKVFNSEQQRFYAGEILLALTHLHKLKIVHRDLKPENILLDIRGHILISDYGSAKITGKEEEVKEQEPANPLRVMRNNSFVGTAQYVSPEVLQGKYSQVGPPADLWALGCLIYQFATGQMAFRGGTEYLIFQKILSLDYEFPEEQADEIDESTVQIVQALLKLDPSERIGSGDDVLYTSIQSHPFFTSIVDWTHLHEMVPPASPLLEIEQFNVPDNIQPGYDPRVMATRAFEQGESGDSVNNTDSAKEELIAKAKEKETSEVSPSPLPEKKEPEPQSSLAPSLKSQSDCCCVSI